ncbi:hypothetical protein HY492_01355 [Candidatus Woesearchaeota archaeon]|nr:hypothetical protein [Candidatus Woesearchaeota archaeon]
MELTYQHIKIAERWTDGNPEKPFGTVLIWAKPYASARAVYARVTPHPDPREKVFMVEFDETNGIERLIAQARLEQECDIINAVSITDIASDNWKTYLGAIAQAYIRGPAPTTRPFSWWQCIKDFFT